MDFVLNGFKQISIQMERQNEIYRQSNKADLSETNVASLLIIFDKNHNILFFNNEWMDYSGIEQENFVLSNSSDEFFLAELVPSISQYLDAVLRNKKKIRFFSNPINTRIGTRYLEFRLLPIFDHACHDQVTGVVAHAWDATEHVILKKELAAAQLAHMKQEAFYKKLFNHTQVIFALHRLVRDAKGRPIDFEYLDVNPVYEKETGRLAKDLIGKTLLTVFPDRGAHSADWMSLFTEVERNGGKITVEHGHHDNDQCYRTAICSPGKGYVATFSENITSYKALEKQLKESNNLWKNALVSAAQGVWQWRVKKSALLHIADTGAIPLGEGFCSPWYKDVFGIEISNGPEWLYSWIRIVHPDDLARMREQCRLMLMKTSEEFAAEHRIIDQDGCVRWLMVKGKKVDNAESDFLEYIGVHTDVSKLKAREKASEECQLQKQEMKVRLLNELADGNLAVIEQVESLMAEAGIRTENNAKLVCLVLDVESHAADFSDYDNRRHRQVLLDQLGILSGFLCWGRMGKTGIVCCAKGTEENLNVAVKNIADGILDKLKSACSDSSHSIGISMPFNHIADLGMHFSNALVAGTWGTKLWPEREIFHYSDVSMYRLMADGSDESRLRNFVMQNLGRLLQYDHKKKLGYLKTLEFILESGNLLEVAQKAYIHPKTAQMRKKKIEEIMDIRLDDMDVRMRLGMAIKLMKLYDY